MVNVPGRSKGCNTCRRRKKGCDLRRPTCARCENDGKTCEGYERSTIWVTYRPKAKKGSTPGSPASIKSDETIDLDEIQEQRAVTPVFSAWPTNLEKSQIELHVLDNFLAVYVPQRHTTTNSGARSWTDQWKGVVVTMSADDALVRRTISALSLSCLGQQEGNTAMIKQGNKLYGGALVQLNGALQRTDAAASHATILATIGLMGLYEQFNGFATDSAYRNQSRAWQAHVLGIQRLLELVGPHAFEDDDAFLIYQACQVAQFTAAFAARKGTAMGSTKWRTIPWNGREKTARDLFFDIAFALPEIVERTEVLEDLTSSAEILSIFGQLRRVMARLEIWKCMMGFGIAVEESGIGDTGLREPSSYDLNDRQTVIMFCAVHVHIAVVMLRLIGRLEPGEQPVTPDPTPHAFWIAQALPSITYEGGILGSQSVLFPIGAVRWLIANIFRTRPDVAGLLRELLSVAMQDMTYSQCMDSFLKNVPAIRLNYYGK